MNDRIMLIDETGQPYIAHAGFFGRRGARQNHKYLMKIGEGAKARYLYTQEEVQAYMRGGRKALKNAANKASDAVGISAKKKLKTAEGKLQSATDSVLNTGTIQRKRSGKELNAAQQKAADDFASASRRYGEAKATYEKSALGKAEKAASTLKSTKDRMKEELRKKANETVDKVEEKSGVKAKRELEKAEKESANAVKAYRDTERAEREMGDQFTGSKLDALRNLNEKNNAEDKAKFDYERTPLGKVEKRLNGSEDGRRHTSQEKAVDKANADWDKEELKVAANRGPIDLDHVSKEYMFDLGSNTGHNSEVKKAMNANDAYNTAKSKYNSITKNKNATATDIRLAAKEMNDAKEDYDKTMENLSKVLNADVEEAKEKLKKSK